MDGWMNEVTCSVKIEAVKSQKFVLVRMIVWQPCKLAVVCFLILFFQRT